MVPRMPGKLTGQRAWCQGAGGQHVTQDSSSLWSPCHIPCTCGAGLLCVSSCVVVGWCGMWSYDCTVSRQTAGRHCVEPCGLKPQLGTITYVTLHEKTQLKSQNEISQFFVFLAWFITCQRRTVKSKLFQLIHFSFCMLYTN